MQSALPDGAFEVVPSVFGEVVHVRSMEAGIRRIFHVPGETWKSRQKVVEEYVVTVTYVTRTPPREQRAGDG